MILKPLIWVPYPVTRLGLSTDTLERAEVRHVEIDSLGPEESDRIDEVRFFAVPYGFNFEIVDVVKQMRALEVVQVQFAGVDVFRGRVPDHVTLCSGRGIHDASTSELALTLTLAGLRGIPTYVREQDQQIWDRKWHTSLADSRVVIVGAGAIGAAVRRRVEAFEATPVMVGRTARDGVHSVTELPDLLPEADVVILILPLTADSAGLFDAAMIARMKPGALLVNVARGGIVDTEALIEACTEGRISAALDVTDPEPPPPGHPLWTTPGVLLTPHVGGTASSFYPRAKRLIGEQITRYVAQQPLHNIVSGDY